LPNAVEHGELNNVLCYIKHINKGYLRRIDIKLSTAFGYRIFKWDGNLGF
jgi:hypothetical protein